MVVAMLLGQCLAGLMGAVVAWTGKERRGKAWVMRVRLEYNL
jgi:hypothetical protein